MKSKDMTVGNPFKIILLFSIPLILSATLQQLYNLADNFIAGHFISNLDSFNAVGIVYPITVVFLDIAVGFGVGVGVVAARYFGAKDMKSLKKTATVGLISTIILSLFVTALGFAIIYPLLNAMVGKGESEGCFNEALAYMLIYIAGVIFLFLYNYSMYMFQAFGNSRTPLYFLIFSTLLNIALDLLFVMPIKLGSAGLALGTIISEGIAGILSVLVLFKSINKFDENKYEKFDKGILKAIIGIAAPSILQGCFISVGGVLITSILTSIGGNNVAGGYSAAYKICYMAINIFTVLCNALSSFVSQNVGAKKYDRIMKGYYSTLIIAAIFCALATALILPLHEFWVRLFLNDDAEGDVETIVNAGKLFILCVVPFFIFMVIKIPLDGILKGATDMLGFSLGTSLDLLCRVLGALILGNIFGYEGIFFAWPIGWGVGMVISVTMFFLGRWKKKCGYSQENVEESKAE
jgi:putative MATE family efflux protein